MAADVASAQKASAQSTEYGDTSADLPMAAAPAVALLVVASCGEAESEAEGERLSSSPRGEGEKSSSADVSRATTQRSASCRSPPALAASVGDVLASRDVLWGGKADAGRSTMGEG